MKILLVCDMFSEGCTGLLVAKALNNLGHSVVFQNAALNEDVVKQPYDLAILWTNHPPARDKFTSPVAFVYLDDPTFWQKSNPAKHPDVVTKDFEHVFTINRWEGMDERYAWLPMGFLPEVHTKVPSRETSDVLFVGTNRGGREGFINELSSALPDCTFRLYGNGWDNVVNTRPAYFYKLSEVVSGAKICVTEHYGTAPSTKDFEIPSIGGALMMTDHLDVKMIYPMIPMYHSVDELVRLINYYLLHEEQRILLVQQMKEIALRFTYERQLKILIYDCLNKLS